VKKAAFFFAIFYLLNVVGYGLEVHYCLGKISDINYAFLDTSCACDSANPEKITSSCCNEESFFVQLEDEHQSVSSKEFRAPIVVSDHYSYNESELLAVHTAKCFENIKAPPLPLDRVITYQTFIFYG
jgi:hypothetical protein